MSTTSAMATARAGNVIGGGDWSKDRLIPDLIRGFQAGTTCTHPAAIVSSPLATRLEPLHGYMLLAEKLLRVIPHGLLPPSTLARATRIHGPLSALQIGWWTCGVRVRRGYGTPSQACTKITS